MFKSWPRAGAGRSPASQAPPRCPARRGACCGARRRRRAPRPLRRAQPAPPSGGGTRSPAAVRARSAISRSAAPSRARSARARARPRRRTRALASGRRRASRRRSSIQDESSPARKTRLAVWSATRAGAHAAAKSSRRTAASARWMASRAASTSIRMPGGRLEIERGASRRARPRRVLAGSSRRAPRARSRRCRAGSLARLLLRAPTAGWAGRGWRRGTRMRARPWRPGRSCSMRRPPRRTTMRPQSWILAARSTKVLPS